MLTTDANVCWPLPAGRQDLGRDSEPTTEEQLSGQDRQRFRQQLGNRQDAHYR